METNRAGNLDAGPRRRIARFKKARAQLALVDGRISLGRVQSGDIATVASGHFCPRPIVIGDRASSLTADGRLPVMLLRPVTLNSLPA